MDAAATANIFDVPFGLTYQSLNYHIDSITTVGNTATAQVTTGSTSTISASVAAVPGAMAYAWFVGTAAAEKLQQITTINSMIMTALSTTLQACAGLFTVDRSQNPLEFDGFLTDVFRSGSGSIISTLATGTPGTGTKLTCSNTDASIDQIETVLKSFWDTYRLSPSVIYVNAQEIKNIFTTPETGAFNLQQYDAFVKQRLALGGIAEASFERFLKNDLGRQQLARMFGVSGKLITERAAEGFYRRENESAATEFVFLASSNNLAKVKLDDAQLRAYHTNNLTAYRISERVAVHYVYFPYTNFTAEADKLLVANTNLTAMMQAHHATNTFRYRDTNGTALTFDQAKGQIRAEFLDRTAAVIGGQKAGEFANELFKLPNQAASLLKHAAEKGFTVKATEPFTEMDGPTLTNAPANFARSAFGLSADEALGLPLGGIDGVYLMAFKDRLKPVDPPFVQVKAKVTEDYRRSQSTELTLQEGTKLVQAANDALAKGTSFKDACKALGHVALEVPPFSRNAKSIEIVESRGLMAEEFRDLVFTLTSGKVSSFRPTSGGGFIAHVKGFQPVPDLQVKLELPKYTESLRDNRANYAFREWLSREVERSGVMAPLQTQTKKAVVGE